METEIFLGYTEADYGFPKASPKVNIKDLPSCPEKKMFYWGISDLLGVGI